jgi:uncharacterized coiled-coil protein SlyX
MDAHRLTALEVRLEHQDRVIAELDLVVREFALRVERLERRLRDLGDGAGAPPIGPADDPPPHY